MKPSLHERVTALCAAMNGWPQPAGFFMGVRRIQETVAFSANPEADLALMEKNLPLWKAHYAAKEGRLRRRLDYLMHDLDWQHSPVMEPPKAQAAARPKWADL